MHYADLSKKEKQLIASQYPFKSDKDLFNYNEANVIAGMKTKSDLEHFKEEAEKEGVSLTKKSNFIITRDGPISVIDLALGNFDEDDYRAALELAKINFDAVDVLKDLFSIEATRLKRGIDYEKEIGLGLNSETQDALNSMVNITKIINDVQNGTKLDVQFSNNLAGMISSFDLDDIEDDDFEEDDSPENVVIDI